MREPRRFVLVELANGEPVWTVLLANKHDERCIEVMTQIANNIVRGKTVMPAHSSPAVVASSMAGFGYMLGPPFGYDEDEIVETFRLPPMGVLRVSPGQKRERLPVRSIRMPKKKRKPRPEVEP